MKNLFTLLATLALTSLGTFAQTTDRTSPDTTYVDTTWKKGAKFALTFSQVSFSNWTAGGENSFGGNSIVNLFANYKEGKRIWDNHLDMAFGIIKLDGENARKSDDKIDGLSKFGVEISNKLYFSTNLNFKTQFTRGYNYPNDSVKVSDFLSPAYIQLGLGIDYKPASYFSLSFLPLTGRITIVTDQDLADIGAYGVDPAEFDTSGTILLKHGKNTRFELGTSVIAMFQKEIVKNIEFKSKLQLFSNYLANPENIDINWDSMLALKVNKYISTYLGLIIVYDEDIPIIDSNGIDIGPRTQLKQTFGIGLTFEL
ncbi:MAG TPA: DUF3078 domain-containing protein [Lentimicrobium sp.]|nr:DUF3078 domain-containing protein [Lentimicrobium sp.]